MGSNLMHEMDDWEVAGQCTCKRQYFPDSLWSGLTPWSSFSTSSCGARASHIPSWPCLSSQVSIISQSSIPQRINKKRKEDLCTHTLTSKEDQVHRGIRVVRSAVHPILRHLGPRDDLHAPQSLAQRLDLRLLIRIPLEHERVPIARATWVTRLQQGLQPRTEPGERAGLPLFLPRERL